jgi:hypothetical protein
MGLEATITASISGAHTAALDLGEARLPLSIAAQIQLVTGTGAGQSDQVFTDRRTLSASAAESLDLAGSLTNAFGATITFARIKAVYVKAAAANTNDVQVTRPAANGVPLFLAASDGLAVRPGGCFLWACSDGTAVPVTAGTGDLLTFTNSAGGTSVDYEVVIVGSTA